MTKVIMKGYKVKIYLQDGTSQERFDIMKAFGVDVTRISNVPEIQEALKTTNNDFVAATNILKQHIRDRQVWIVGLLFLMRTTTLYWLINFIR